MIGPLLSTGRWMIELCRAGSGATDVHIESDHERLDDVVVRVWSVARGERQLGIRIERGIPGTGLSFVVADDSLYCGSDTKVTLVDLVGRGVRATIDLGTPVRFFAALRPGAPVIVLFETGVAAVHTEGLVWRWDAGDLIASFEVRDDSILATDSAGATFSVSLATGDSGASSRA